MDRTSDAHAVYTRLVFYIPGFDPMPPRSYRERYRREAAQQAAISGYQIETLPAEPGDTHAWNVCARIDGHDTQSEVRVLYWADLVQQSMEGGTGDVYRYLFRTAWVYIGSGALSDLMRLRKGPIIAALYPLGVLLVQGALACCMVILAAIIGWLLAAIAGLLIGVGIGALAGRLFLQHCRRRDRFMAWYLMQDYAYSASKGGAYPTALEERLRVFSSAVEEALARDVDEVLVVGHSSGAYLAVTMLADILEERRDSNSPSLSLLTLGHVVPMVSFLPKAHRLRRDLARLSASADVTWVDVSAPGDGCSFALCDPVAVTGVAPKDKRWPLVLSAAFTNTLSDEKREALKWRLFETHFQYLNAFDQPGTYDYFQITAGPESLAVRFSTAAPSPSRIETPVNRHATLTS